MNLGGDISEENDTNKGSMWVLDQKLDQPMDEEAGRLRTMYREKVLSLSLDFVCLNLCQSTGVQILFNQLKTVLPPCQST